MHCIPKILATAAVLPLVAAGAARAADPASVGLNLGPEHARTESQAPAATASGENGAAATPGETILGSPAGVPFQGFLTDAGGNPLGVPAPVNVTVDFNFWDAAVGGTLLYNEAQVVSVSEGVFQANLTPPANLFHGLPRFLGLSVNAGPELTPRTPVLSAPFAHVSRTLSGFDEVDAQLQQGGGLTEIVAGTTDQTMRRYFLTPAAGSDWTAKDGRVIVAANGQGAGGGGTVTVELNSVPVATLSVPAGGTRPWTYVVELPGLANNAIVDVFARATSASAPLLVRNVTLETDTDTNTIGDGDWTIVGSNISSAVSGNVGVGVAAASTNAKLDVSGGTARGLEVVNSGATDRFAVSARNTSAGGTTAMFDSPASVPSGWPSAGTAVAARAAGTDQAGFFTSDDGDAVWARVDGTGSAIRGWDFNGNGLAGEFFGEVAVSGNITSSSGDYYAAAGNGVINCGGGVMNSFANVIADVTPTITFATGDEDLFIQDDLEVLGQGYKPGGGSWASVSDARLKTDVRNFEDGLDAVLAIRPVWYRYSEATAFADGREYVGVLAQEVRDVAPYSVEERAFGQVVREDENGREEIVDPGENFLTYDSSSLVFLLVNAVKEQQEMLEKQRGRIEELERRLGP